MKIPAEVFRAYDIRGIAGRVLSAALVREVGRALGALGRARGAPAFAVGRDGRLSSPELCAALMDGLNAAGADVIELGVVPTPVTYFAAQHLGCHSAVMVTGSHNPGDQNGLKMVVAGTTLTGEEIQGLRRAVEAGRFEAGAGSRRSADVLDAYVERIAGDIRLARPMRIALDCGNGVAGVVAPRLFRELGCEVSALYAEVDGRFPNHHPDPSRLENLRALIDTVKAGDAELGLAFDGDADRLGVVTKNGAIILPDRQLMLYAQDVLSRNPGAEIIYDVKCTRLLGPWIERHGGRPVIWKTGHSLIKAKLRETGAPLAGEMSGHIFFKERWYGFDDALYAAARLCEILVSSGKPPAEVFAELPGGFATPELRLDMPESRHADFMERVTEAAAMFEYAELNTLDGVRVEFVDSWGLVRPSNTTPCLTLRFEGDDAEALADVQARFRKLLLGIDGSLHLPF